MPSETPPGRLDDVADGAEFAFVVSLWRRAGWTVRSADDDAIAFATRTSNGTRRRTVLHVFRSTEGMVSGTAMRSVVASLQPADRVTAVSLVGFAPAALDVADAHGVDVVGPDSVRRLLDAHDATDLVDAAQ